MARAFDGIPDLVTVLRISDKALLYVNASFEGYSGLAASDVVGSATKTAGLWEDPDLRNRWIERVASEGLARDFEAGLRTASGEKSKSEAQGFGADEFVPWQIGAVM